VNDNVAEIIVEIGERIVLNSYPYFDLSDEERNLAKKDKVTWNNFCRAVQDCTKSTGLVRDIIREMMDYMGIDAFVDSGGSSNDILGIFGEL
jgi:hypothetical protein